MVSSSDLSVSIQATQQATPTPKAWLAAKLGSLYHSYRFISLISLLILLASLVLLSFATPQSLGSLYRCPVNYFLKIQCPGCGSMRALHSLLHADIKAALGYNFLAVILLPVLFISFIMGLVSGNELRLGARGFAILTRILLFIILCFTIGRNLIIHF